MKILKYEIYQTTLEDGKVITIPKELPWSELYEETAKAEAYKGEYTIEDDGVSPYPTAPHNIMEGECVTINDVMYKAIANIPNGEPVIVGQNAIETTIEAQLLELKGE